MKLFIQVMFAANLISALCRLLLMQLRKYPEKAEHTLGKDVGSFIEYAIFAAWAGVILWGADATD